MEKTVERECVHHGITVYVFRKSENRYRCRKCAVDAVSNTRRKLKLKAIEYKGGCCQRCSYNKSVWALEFHHTDRTKKDFNIAGDVKSWKRMQPELDKCILLCRNCHAETHEELSKSTISSEA